MTIKRILALGGLPMFLFTSSVAVTYAPSLLIVIAVLWLGYIGLILGVFFLAALFGAIK